MTTEPIPTDADFAYAADRHKCALWYAWGQIDAGIGGPDVDPFDFAQHHRAEALAYRTEARCWLPSITGAWTAYLAEQVTP